MTNDNYTVDVSSKAVVTAFFHSDSNTLSYVVKDPESDACAVVDAVLDFDYAAGRTDHLSADKIVEFIEQHGLKLTWIIETHVHADHLSAAPYIKERLGGRMAIGANIAVVQDVFARFFNEGTEFERDGSQFDHLFADGERYSIGALEAVAMATPGHTPACMTHIMGDAAFVGDTLFMPDGGSARADFPGGDAGELYDSVQKILQLPDAVRIFVCHDYAPNEREIAWETSVADERSNNIHFADGVSRAKFIAMRESRDATLGMPRLMLPSIQVNMRAGALPTDSRGDPALKVPLNKL